MVTTRRRTAPSAAANDSNNNDASKETPDTQKRTPTSKKRQNQEILYENADIESPTKKHQPDQYNSDDTSFESGKRQPPKNFAPVISTLRAFRETFQAPVDTIGCDKLHAKQASEKQRRFQILVSLMLSSQTKDTVNAVAMANLHQAANEMHGQEEVGITVDTLLQMTDSQLNECIQKVGFHHRKTQYLKQAAEILRAQYESDIPETVQELIKLPGVGPKMAHLCVQAAWQRVEGIGVDTHVHRISNRLGWTSGKIHQKGPEATRLDLESWLPREHWSEINTLLVGLGQVVCSPIKPKCTECALRNLCPSSSAKDCKPKPIASE